MRATGRFGTDARGCRLLVQYARQWPDRIWAVEGANGAGRSLAQRLLASGERVLDVPARLSARARVAGTGQGRKTAATGAHSIVMIALRDKGLRELGFDPELLVLRMLCDRRDELSRARAQALNRMHRSFPGLRRGVERFATRVAAIIDLPDETSPGTRRRHQKTKINPEERGLSN